MKERQLRKDLKATKRESEVDHLVLSSACVDAQFSILFVQRYERHGQNKLAADEITHGYWWLLAGRLLSDRTRSFRLPNSSAGGSYQEPV